MAHGPRLPIVARNPQMLNASHALAAKSGARRRSSRSGLIAPSGSQNGAPGLSKKLFNQLPQLARNVLAFVHERRTVHRAIHLIAFKTFVLTFAELGG